MGRFIDSGNQVGRTRSDIQAAGPRRCQSQIVLLLLGCKAGLIGILQKGKDPAMKLTDFCFFLSLHGGMTNSPIDELFPESWVVNEDFFLGSKMLLRVPQAGGMRDLSPQPFQVRS